VHVCACTTTDCEWEPARPEANLTKHGVRFVDAVFVSSDYAALTIADARWVDKRFVTARVDALARVHAMVWTWRGEVTISVTWIAGPQPCHDSSAVGP
jgi:uncharacterized DUF497 family protein